MAKKVSELTVGWKVCAVLGNGQLESAIRTGSPNVNYSREGWIHPLKGENQFLFVFKTQADAEAFRKDRGGDYKNDYALLKVAVKGASDKGKLFGANSYYYAKNFPKGTFFAKAVRVIGRVHTAYKVVREHARSYESAIMRTDKGRAPIKYQENRWVKPRSCDNQFLFVFKDENSARSFRYSRYDGPFAVYRADVLGLIDTEKTITGEKIFADSYPLGTRFTKAVKLTERLV